MKKIIQLLVLISFVHIMYAQDNSQYRIISSNIGVGGSSKAITTPNGQYKISQSIGQSSVIGTHHNNGYYLRQGYQQPTSRIKIIKDLDAALRAKVYPNPFSQILHISFSDIMKDDISVKVFNIEARVIHTQLFSPAQQIELMLPDIASGSYFLKVNSGVKQFKTKLIKI